MALLQFNGLNWRRTAPPRSPECQSLPSRCLPHDRAAIDRRVHSLRVSPCGYPLDEPSTGKLSRSIHLHRPQRKSPVIVHSCASCALPGTRFPAQRSMFYTAFPRANSPRDDELQNSTLTDAYRQHGTVSAAGGCGQRTWCLLAGGIHAAELVEASESAAPAVSGWTARSSQLSPRAF